ncbi:proline iminopeptidase [Deinococcus metalli]|uniref:prolyl aminopeptidase n=1 Tax=Deinococcus metalli TaxID=1141878 RepID=A0A7W8NLG6_9DEIO|nr:alpha/beta hydrolase [Deinococcus metalli]MBB5374704.1 proline iminopeptidase [Deinococcus metalli]GHF34331.1 proline iminopeptidase [Deinococcus metalli]
MTPDTDQPLPPFDPDSPLDSEWPDTQVQFERLNGADLYFEVTGEDDGAAPVVFLHGGPGYNAYSFQAMFGERMPRRTVYLDQRGSGRSGPLEDTEQGADTLDLDTLVGDVEALREFLGAERIVPLGHGFGALVALEYARRLPTRTERVIVVNPWVHFPALALTLLAEASARRGVALDDPAAQVRAGTPEGQHPAVGAARIEQAFSLLNARDLLNALHFRDASSRLRLEFLDAEGQLVGGGEVQQALVNQGLWEFEYAPFLAELRRPVYVIAGVHDRSSYPEQVEYVADLADGDVTVLDAGHYPWLDAEDDFAEALEDALRR